MTAEFIAAALARPARPRLFVRVNGLTTGLIDADLDAIVPARPDAILLPKAEGAAAMVEADAKLAAREAAAGIAGGHVKIVAQAIETVAGIFLAGTFRNSSKRLIGLTWGPEDLMAELGAEANRDADGHLTEPYRLARAILPVRSDRGPRCGDRNRLCRFPQPRRLAKRNRKRAPRRLHGSPCDPSGAGACDQRGVHADARGDRKGARDHHSLRGGTGQRGGRHRGQDVRPPAPRTRQEPVDASRRVPPPAEV